MQGLRGLAWLLALQSAGELLARALSLPFPGPVVGMVLLLVALRWPLVREPVAQCADFLLSHLSLLFIPVGVGVMTHLNLLSTYGGRIALVIVLSTWVGLAVTAWVLFRLTPESESELDQALKSELESESGHG
jgi:holin-like protein